MGFCDFHMSEDDFDELTEGLRSAEGGLSRQAFTALVQQQLREYVSSELGLASRVSGGNLGLLFKALNLLMSAASHTIRAGVGGLSAAVSPDQLGSVEDSAASARRLWTPGLASGAPSSRDRAAGEVTFMHTAGGGEGGRGLVDLPNIHTKYSPLAGRAFTRQR